MLRATPHPTGAPACGLGKIHASVPTAGTSLLLFRLAGDSLSAGSNRLPREFRTEVGRTCPPRAKKRLLPKQLLLSSSVEKAATERGQGTTRAAPCRCPGKGPGRGQNQEELRQDAD